MNEPIGRFGSCRPARARRTAVDTAFTASAWPTTRLPICSSILQQLLALAFEHAVDRNAGPARDHLRDVVGGHRLLGDDAAAGRRPRSPSACLSISGMRPYCNLAGALIIAAALGIGEFVLRLVELRSCSFCAPRQLVLLGLPLRGQRVGLFLQRREILFQPLEAVLASRRSLSFFSASCSIFRRTISRSRLSSSSGLESICMLQPRRRLVDQVDRLVGQEAVGDVAVRQASPPRPARASVIRTPWCASYLSFRPRRIEMVSSTVGSLT